MALTERLALLITADATQAVRALDGLGDSSARLGNAEPRLSRVGQTLTRTVTPAAIATGAAAMTMFNQFDQGADALVAAGAVGDQFTDSMKRVGNQVPESLGQVGQVMGEVYQRTRLTGEPLEELTQRVIELGRLGQNVSVEQLTASLTKAGVSAEGMSDALDTMYGVTQVTGTSVEKLSSLQEQFGVVLAETGMSLEDQLLLLGQMEAQGINTSSVLGGLTRGYRTLAESTDDPAAALETLLQRMSDAETQAEATAIGNEAFGRSAVEVAAAAQAGALDIDGLSDSLANNTQTISEAGDGMLDLADHAKIMMNRIVGLVGPMGETVFLLSGIAAGAGPAAQGVSKLSTSLKGLTSVQMASTLASSQLGSAVSVMGLAAGTAAAAGVAALVYRWQEAQAEAERLDQRVTALSDQMAELGDAEGLRAVLSQGVEAAPQFARLVDEMGVSVDQLAAALEAGGSEWEQFRDRAMAAADGSMEMGVALDGLEATYAGAVEHQSNLNDVVDQSTAATQEAADAYQELNDAINAVTDPVFAYTDALADHQQAQAESNALMASGTASADQLRDADLRVRDSALSLVAASNTLNGALQQNPQIVSAVTSALDGMAAQGLITTAQAAAFKAEVMGGTAQLDRLSSTPWQVNLDTSTASARLQAMLAQTAQLQAAIGGSLAGNQQGLTSASAAQMSPGATSSAFRSRPIVLQVGKEVVGRISSEELRRSGEAGYGIPLGVAG